MLFRFAHFAVDVVRLEAVERTFRRDIFRSTSRSFFWFFSSFIWFGCKLNRNVYCNPFFLVLVAHFGQLK